MSRSIAHRQRARFIPIEIRPDIGTASDAVKNAIERGLIGPRTFEGGLGRSGLTQRDSLVNVTVTWAISALRKHERLWEIGDIVGLLEASRSS